VDLTGTSEKQTMSEIIRAYARSRVVERKWRGRGERQLYRYIINPITENIPPPDPFWSEWIARRIHTQTSNGIDKVVTAEALGLPIAQLVASLKGKPLAVVRKRDFYAKSQLLAKARYASGFERGTYWVYGVSEGENVLIVDDAVSTGGTLVALISALQQNRVSIKDVFCVLEKPEYRGVSSIKKATGITVKTLFQVDTKSRKCVPTKNALPDCSA
jgi:adenine phosphoribosyltransferase